VSSVWLQSAAGRLAAAAGDYLAANSLRSSAPREHIRSTTGFDPLLFDLVVAEAERENLLKVRGAGLAPPGYAVALVLAQQREADRYLAALRAGGFSPPTDSPPSAALVEYLSETGAVVDVGAGVVFDAGVFAGMVARIVEHIEANGSISLAQVRDLFGTSRKYAQALIEHLDAEKVTRRVGDMRVLRAPAEAGR
jgi:selenocysteine-specific elongation factor